jgi:hypothetical protein
MVAVAPMLYSCFNSCFSACVCLPFLLAADLLGKIAVTHLFRNSTMCEETEAGVPHPDVLGKHGLVHGTGVDVYLRGAFWTLPILKSAGWEDLKRFLCHWEGRKEAIPKELLQLGELLSSIGCFVM